MKIIELYKSAINARAPWIERWKQCKMYTMPETDSDDAALYDSTAAQASTNLAANMFSLLTPSESLWLSLERESEASPDLETPQMALRAALNDSNFYTTIHQCYLDLIILGTSCLLMSETATGAASAFSFAAIPMTDIAVLRDSSGQIASVFHTKTMSSADIAESYPTWIAPQNLRTLLKDHPETELKLIQSVVKNKQGSWDFCAWIDVGGNFENNVVTTGTFVTNPYIIFRWMTASGDSYGRSPVMSALPDIKTANKVVELVLKNAAIAVSGVWQADDDGVINLQNISLVPGSIIPKAVGSSGLTPLKSGADFDVSQLILNDLRTRINRALLADKLSAFTDKEMTATEVLARNLDMMRVLGATYGRILNELIQPLIDRGLSILSRRGVISPILLHSDAELKYSAPISQIAADEKLSGVLSFLATANAGGFGDIINKPALAIYIANTMHIPSELLIGE